MRKIKLEIESLSVESFETAPAVGSRGTVHGHESENTLCNWCTNSRGYSPVYTACDISCEFECTPTVEPCGTEINCPGTGTGGTGTGTGTGGATAAYTNCDQSCEFVC